jgi:hypothetical protein
MQFNYANPAGWSMSAALVNLGAPDATKTLDSTSSISCVDPGSKSPLVSNNANLLRFYVDNSALETRQDVVFNGVPYQLQFIEIYSPPLHTFGEAPPAGGVVDAGGIRTPPSYDVEIVLCHSTVSRSPASGSVDPTNPDNIPESWVNVSVFAKQMPTFSLSQSFFYDLLTPIIASNPGFVDTATDSGVSCNTTAWEDCMDSINWQTPVTNGGRTPSASPMSSCSGGSHAMLLQTKSYWSPYQVLPGRKSFYTYKGEFPYAPCFYKGMSPDSTPVQWVVLDNSVTINTADYNNLQTLLQNVALFNVGTNYPKLSPLREDMMSIAYNNGKLVSGNTDNDKFYVKCEKAGDLGRSSGGNDSSGLTAADLSVERELSQIPGDTTTEAPRPNTVSTFYTPPTSVMSTLAFCLLIGLAIFGMFAAANWSITSGSGAGGGSGGFGGEDTSASHSYSLMALMILALLVMYCTALFTSSLSVGSMLGNTLIFSFVGMLLSGAAMYTDAFHMFGHHSSAANAQSSALDGGVASGGTLRVLQIGSLSGIAILLIVALVLVIILPAVHTGRHINQNYSFYYTYGSSPDTVLFIGTRANIQVKVSGFTLNYGNDYTVAQHLAEKAYSGTAQHSSSTTTTGPDGIPKNSLMRIPQQVWNPPPTLNQQNASLDGGEGTAAGAPAGTAGSSSSSSRTQVGTSALPQSLFESPTGYANANTDGKDHPGSDQSPQVLSNTSTQTSYTPETASELPGDYRKAYTRKYKDNLNGMLVILKEYNRLMQTSSEDPFGTFVQAYINYTNTASDPWFATRRALNPLSFDTKTVGTVILNHYPDLYLYLNGMDRSELPLQQNSASSPTAPV